MTDSNINLPGISIRAFNIIPGVAFADEHGFPWVATRKLIRDHDEELMHIVARPAEVWNEENVTDPVRPKSFTFDFNDAVLMVGVTPNPNDADSTDLGNNFSWTVASSADINTNNVFVPNAEAADMIESAISDSFQRKIPAELKSFMKALHELAAPAREAFMQAEGFQV